ncbi:M48 family metallopeptidase [Vibrio sp. STUT-A11]|uniref:M48 family metallopeptidase n=1 Tax=unclassified Vibrio TaxID=2614977 RepID=UPI002232A8B2|nr:M48 family metallopeptidase [Vibrio sp. STUT-A11]BDR16287.1 hypothetical protein VspSTUT11_42630 [Vibrio sp. STUT-A11]
MSRPDGWITRMENSSRVAVVSTVILILLMSGGFVYGIPWVSQKAVMFLPDTVATHVGKQVLTTLDEKWFEPSELPLSQQQEIRQRFQSHIDSLVADGEAFPSPPNLVFRHWDEGVNAFALSNGTIIVTDDIVEAMVTPAQLDSVLFHELGHVKYEHVMQSVIRASLLSVAVALVTGESSGVIDNLVGAGVFLFSNGYSRDNEAEADQYALKAMLRIYGTTVPMQEMFKLLQASSSGHMPEWLSTHPDINARIEASITFNESTSEN